MNLNKKVTNPTFSEKYSKACMARDVPASILYENMMECRGKTPEEQVALKDQFAAEILDKYPPKHRRNIQNSLLKDDDSSLS